MTDELPARAGPVDPGHEPTLAAGEMEFAGPDPGGEPDPVRERVAKDLDSNVLLQYAFSKATRLSRSGQLAEAAREYAKIAGATNKPAVRGFAYVLQAEMLLRDPGTVLDVTTARAALEKAQELEAPVREWTFTLGMLALREGRLAEARPLLVRSFTSGHQPQESAAYLAIVDARLGDREAGRQWLELARENGAAWRSPEAEIALRAPDDPPAALAAAADEHPEEFWLRLALARELTATGRHAELIELTSRLSSDEAVPERFRAVAALGAAHALLLHGDDTQVGEALTFAGQARSLTPKALPLWEVLSIGWARQGRFRRAAGAARRLIRADPEAAGPRYVQAWSLAGRGKRAASEAALAEAVARDPDWPLRGKVEDAVAACR